MRSARFAVRLVAAFALVGVALPASATLLSLPPSHAAPVDEPWTGYPQTSAFRHIIALHSAGPSSATLRDPLILRATWVEGDGEGAFHLQVSESGAVHTVYHFFPGDAHRNPNLLQLSPEAYAAVKKAVANLPLVDVRPLLADLVIVSRHVDGEWETTLYDACDPPEELVALYRLTQGRAPLCMMTRLLRRAP